MPPQKFRIFSSSLPPTTMRGMPAVPPHEFSAQKITRLHRVETLVGFNVMLKPGSQDVIHRNIEIR